MKKTIFSLATLAMIAASCSDEVVNRTPDSLKDIISFSSDGTEGLISGSQTRAGFTSATDMVIRLQSDDRSTAATATKYTCTTATANADGEAYYSTVGNNGDGFLSRYWDDAHGRNSLLSAYAVAVPNKSLSATALTANSLAGGATWATEATPNNSITWSVSTSNLTTTNLDNEDLTYSNNIQADATLGINGRYVWDYNEGKYKPENLTQSTHSQLGSKRMRFTQSAKLDENSILGTEAGHFDKGHLHFQHALSRMTIKIVEGDGFTKNETSPTDFKWTSGGSEVSKNTIQILANTVGTSGTLDVKAGSWGDPTNHTKAGISTLATLGTSYDSSTGVFSGDYVDAAGYYRAQMIPGFLFAKDGTTNVLQFSIDNNTIKVTNGMIFKALYDNAGTGSGKNGLPLKDADNNDITSYKMEQGKNYVLEITVKKTGIQAITATVAPWVDVAGKIEVNNAHLTFDLKTSGTACDKDIDLYRLSDDNPSFNSNEYTFTYQGKNWKGNYNDKTELLQSAKGTNGKWTTPWYFESNKTYYHFRTVNKGTVIKDNDNTNDDYFVIAGGSQSTTDPHWGAPFETVTATTTSKPALEYDATNGGYKHVHYAIGATESDINIQELHMMSNINVILKTKAEGKVQLYKPAVNYTNYNDYNTTNNLTSGQTGYLADQSAFDALTDAQKIKTPAVPTVVKITRLSSQGKVYMGNGKVEPIAPVSPATYNDAAFSHTMDGPAATSASTFFKTEDTETNVYSYAVVPQELCRVANSTTDDDYVGIFIQTPDNNQYYVIKKLSEILANEVDDQRNQTKGQKITRWFPGHKYTYTITITKTGIQAITATVADWVDVKADNIDINLEN